jgi:hypothetical protein
MQVTTNILIGEYTEPIVLVYQGLLYTLYIEMYMGVYIYIVCVVIVLTLLYVMFVLIFL